MQSKNKVSFDGLRLQLFVLMWYSNSVVEHVIMFVFWNGVSCNAVSNVYLLVCFGSEVHLVFICTSESSLS